MVGKSINNINYKFNIKLNNDYHHKVKDKDNINLILSNYKVKGEDKINIIFNKYNINLELYIKINKPRD